MSKARKEIEASLAKVQGRLEAALEEAGRPAGSCRIVAVTKRQPAARIEAALEIGMRRFGENVVQEAESRWPALRERFDDIELHFIGRLQSNKVKNAVALFDVIETLDRAKLARRIAREMKRTGRKPRLFIQVNTGGEPQKGGISGEGLPELLSLCREELGLEIEGLMCLPPADEDPAPHFAALRELAGKHDVFSLSMGMSGDYETAAKMGAAFVRIGTAIFGPRP